ncbi:ATP-dependent DNA helicase [Chitinimonas sp. BJB300]|uniref:ATP-dependent DNA helicase n=1 Tax=Chitinimonas sp. BJB300 TaxID=1559339 RepID=UPI000C0ED2CC|nr:ATP-dependent DNA helicase [Chitinimonas sp. BJB300]PHV11745.1 helicase [Chitinimonas sp. BJB300]TSJ90001.1 ATP-dependent DNA helicase [Chitinimonas sp. BJB300]
MLESASFSISLAATLTTLADVFSEGGLFAQAMPGYRPRAQQVEMAEAVERAIRDKKPLIAEAGTGTGKTYAYLVPALLSGGKVIVSTGTKTLQDQLFHRDLPKVRVALKVPVTTALLKGRSNYVCRYHLERATHEGRFARKEDVAQLHAIVRFAATSADGDKSGCAAVPESSPVWQQAISTRENCLGSECPYHQDCFVLQARRQALDADVVVVNHHLFFADVWLKDEGAGELLPRCNTIIFDEAHQLPEVASLFFGETVSSGTLLELARDSRAEALSAAKDFVHLPAAALALDKAIRDLRLVFGQETLRAPRHALTEKREFHTALAIMESALSDLADRLAQQAERSEGLENCRRRAEEQLATLCMWINGAASAPNQESSEGADTDSAKPPRSKDPFDDAVFWLEVSPQGFQLNATPLDIARLFARQMNEERAWVFTSATLAMDGNFKHYAHEMGLWDAEQAAWESPFAYKQQAVLYVPQGLPDPNSREYTAQVVEATLPLLQLSQGRAFLLFTSLRAMREAYDLIQARLPVLGLSYPLLLQGEGTRTELLERFRTLPNAVLIASQTFWEGIDVKGEQLQLVVIDKLPFAAPDDPVLAARIDKINKAGRNAFMEYQLPRAAITLKQGAGRLIRDEADRGVLMIADPRLVEKPYGKAIWKALPPMRRTRELAIVEQFFRTVDHGQTPNKN